MLKKVLSVLVFVLLLSTSALAFNDNWMLNLKVGTLGWTNMASETIFSVHTATSVKVDYDSRDVRQAAYWGSTLAGTVMYRGDPGGWAGRPSDWFIKDTRPVIPSSGEQTWSRIYAAMGSGFPGNTLQLGWFVNSSRALDLTQHLYRVRVVSDPTGQHQGDEYWWALTGGDTSLSYGGTTANPLLLWTWDLAAMTPQQKALITADSPTQILTNHIELELWVGVPEPSSLLALACGLAGLAGMALRRRAG